MWTKERIGSDSIAYDVWTRDIEGGSAIVSQDIYEPTTFAWGCTFTNDDVEVSMRGTGVFDTPEEAMLACDQAIERYGVRS
ncbi:MAG: hypothetical protein KJ042_05635 [Deltaproteobacteria bacterium]|nr:hypothetical protein [Deltaproteobacteria bacterium]